MVDTDLVPAGHEVVQLGGLGIGVGQRTLDRDAGLDLGRITTGVDRRLPNDVVLAQPVGFGTTHVVPHVGDPSGEGQADLFAVRADAHRRNHLGQRRRGGLVDREVFALEARRRFGPHQPTDRHDLFELGVTNRRLGELVAVGLVFVGAPTGADSEHEAILGEDLQRRSHLGGQRRRTVAVAQDVVAELHVGELGGEPGE